MPQTQLELTHQYIIARLQKELSPELTYHSVNHTLDVLKQVKNIAIAEGIEDPEELLLLQVSALYHDTGFLTTYAQHEEKSSELAREELPEFGFSTAQIEIISGLILATKVPQVPQTKLQEILCDADLDYLGRNDFFPIGNLLFQEFQSFGVIQDELQWNQLQVRFLESHRFFTRFANNNREPQKQKHLELIKAKIN